jgi:xylan 1,4-beta-xylosidase
MLAAGIRPFVEFGFCPSELATVKGTIFWWKANGSPPNDYPAWGQLIDHTVRHWVERYGIEEVRQWYFEVWNEPNLHVFFKGTRTQYFELYRITAQTIKAIDPALRVGGPATSNFVPDARFSGDLEDPTCHAVVTKAKDLDSLDWRPAWVEDFLAWCAREKLPVDFVSTHPYPTDWALDDLGTGANYTRSVDSTRRDLTLLRQIINASAYPQAQIHLTEWSSSPSPRDFTHDYPQAATFIIKANLESIGLVDSLSYWTFTDVFEESGAGPTPLHGGFGMINYQGIPKPSFHAYRLLNTLGDELLKTAPGGVVTRHRSSGKIAALVYHYPAEVPQAVPTSGGTRDLADATMAQGTPENMTLELTGLAPHAPLLIETLGVGHGDVLSAWRALGEPTHFTTKITANLLAQAHATGKETLTADAQGRCTLQRTLAPWTVLSVREC